MAIVSRRVFLRGHGTEQCQHWEGVPTTNLGLRSLSDPGIRMLQIMATARPADPAGLTPAPAPGVFPPSPPPPPLFGQRASVGPTGLDQDSRVPVPTAICNEYTVSLGQSLNRSDFTWMDQYAMPLLLSDSSYWSGGYAARYSIVLPMRVWLIAQGFIETSRQANPHNNIWNLQTDAAKCPNRAWIADRGDYTCTDPSQKATPPQGWAASIRKLDRKTGQMVTYYYCLKKICSPRYDNVIAAADGYVDFTASLGKGSGGWLKLHDDLLNPAPVFATFVQDLAIFGGVDYGKPQVLKGKLVDAGQNHLAPYLDDRIDAYDKSISCLQSNGGSNDQIEGLKRERTLIETARGIARGMK